MNHWRAWLSLEGIYTEKERWLTKIGLKSVTRILRHLGISPNLISMINLSIGMGALICLFENQTLFALLMLLNIIIDIFDGYYARAESLETKMGKWLDHGGDYMIGLLFLVKSYAFMNSSWIILVIFMYIVELLIIYKWKLWKDNFPSRVFLIFYIFGYFHFGLLIQALVQAMSIIFFWVKLNIR